MTTQPTYTLAEAARELARRECRARGHDFTFMERRLMDEAPTGIVCIRCGWTGDVTMGEKP
jgi:hypothetical protein